MRSRNSVRLARPVSASCSAWCSLSSAWREERRLGRLALRDVLDHRDREAAAALDVAHERDRRVDPAHVAVAADEAVVEAQRLDVVARAAGSRRARASRSSGWTNSETRCAEQVLEAVAQQLLDRGVGVEDAAVEVGHEHPGQRAGERRLEPRERLDLVALGLELGGAADGRPERDREQLERAPLLLAEPLGPPSCS